MKALQALATVGLLACFPIVARSGEDSGVTSMRWVKRVCVVVDAGGSSDEFTRLITPDGVRTTVELRLREAGVIVADPDDISPDIGTLNISINGLQIGDEPRYAIGVSESFGLILWHLRAGKPNVAKMGTTWHEGGVFVWGAARLANEGPRGLLARYTDKFLNAWLAAHPVRDAAPTQP